jgi:hypothetical protein
VIVCVAVVGISIIIGRVDMIEVFKHFDNFADEEVIGVANDLTPHYFDHAQEFIKQNPGTRVGYPGRFQVKTLR